MTNTTRIVTRQPHVVLYILLDRQFFLGGVRCFFNEGDAPSKCPSILNKFLNSTRPWTTSVSPITLSGVWVVMLVVSLVVCPGGVDAAEGGVLLATGVGSYIDKRRKHPACQGCETTVPQMNRQIEPRLYVQVFPRSILPWVRTGIAAQLTPRGKPPTTAGSFVPNFGTRTIRSPGQRGRLFTRPRRYCKEKKAR